MAWHKVSLNSAVYDVCFNFSVIGHMDGQTAQSVNNIPEKNYVLP
jgi:hypothetical protein